MTICYFVTTTLVREENALKSPRRPVSARTRLDVGGVCSKMVFHQNL